MDPNQLTEILRSCLNPATRDAAEKMLLEAEKQNPALYLQMLCMELSSEDRPPETRHLAGLVLKNSLTAKDDARKLELVNKWLALDVNLKAQIKQAVLATLNSPQKDPRGAASQVISKIAYIDVSRNQWPELIPALLANVQSENDQLKQSSLETLGFLCEELEENYLKTKSNEILTAVCRGIKDNNNTVKLAGCNAMHNALEFVKSNFERENERNYIMQVLVETAVCPDVKVRQAAMECFVKIASLYYDKLAPYMHKIFTITIECIKKDEEAVAQQAVEFWSTICDEESYLLSEDGNDKQCHNFIRGALKFLVPLLTETLTRQEDEPDEDTWNVAMAAGTCLSLVAATVGDDVVDEVIPFVQKYINDPNWKFREAATLAFGAILEGPKAQLSNLISQALPVLLQHLTTDTVVYVKDTTAWTIGRVCQLHPEAVSPTLNNVMTALVIALADSPRVASNVCWAIHNLALEFEEEAENASSPLSAYFNGLLEKLLLSTERQGWDESNLRSSAYEAINVLIQAGAQDTIPTIQQAVPLFLDRLEKSFTMQLVSTDDKDEQTELQSLLCGVLQVIIQKLGDGVKPFADRMMQNFLTVFSAKSATVHEETLMAIGAIANAVEGDFEKYMSHFRPYLVLGLRNHEEHQVCSVAVGVVGDVARALVGKIAPYCDEIVSLLLANLQNPNLNRNVKPPILSCFGDIALAIGGEFGKYLGMVMHMLQQASTTVVPADDDDLVDYLNVLREGIFEAYTGIIQGLRGDGQASTFKPYVEHLVSFIGFVAGDPNRSDDVTRGAVGVIGDLVHSLGPQVKTELARPFIGELINECLKSDYQPTADVAAWAKEVCTQQGISV